jgi:hypothetical protein
MPVKWKSYILLFGLLVFLGETSTIPYVANAHAKKSTCKMHKGLKAGMGKDCCSHGAKKSMNCMDCPLCYLAVAAPTFTKTFALAEIKKIQYCIFKNTLLSTYYDETWKPPDPL